VTRIGDKFENALSIPYFDRDGIGRSLRNNEYAQKSTCCTKYDCEESLKNGSSTNRSKGMFFHPAPVSSHSPYLLVVRQS